MEEYNLFKTYVAMKTHFTTDNYDYIKFNGKCSVSENGFLKRKDVSSFRVVASWLPQKHCEQFLLSHFIELSNFTINYIVENPIKSQRIYDRWRQRTQDILENYRKDIKTIAIESNASWKDCITQRDDDYPLLFKLVMSSKITPETYSMLDDLFQHTSKTYKGMDTDVMFQSLNLKYRKYRVFLLPSVHDVLKVTPQDLTTI